MGNNSRNTSVTSSSHCWQPFFFLSRVFFSRKKERQSTDVRIKEKKRQQISQVFPRRHDWVHWNERTHKAERDRGFFLEHGGGVALPCVSFAWVFFSQVQGLTRPLETGQLKPSTFISVGTISAALWRIAAPEPPSVRRAECRRCVTPPETPRCPGPIRE